MILVQYGLAIRGGLRNYSTGCYLVPRTFEDRSPIVLSLEEIPHHIKQVTPVVLIRFAKILGEKP